MGCSLGQPPPKRLWCPVQWRPFDINAPLFGAYRSRIRDQKCFKTKECFTVLWTSGFTRWTFILLLLSNGAKMLLLFRYFFPAWELPSLTLRLGNPKRGRFCFYSFRLANVLCKIDLFLLQVYFLCLMAALKGKAVVKKIMQYRKLITDTRF